MSDNFLRIIPREPELGPSEAAAEAAIAELSALIPIRTSIEAKRFPEIRFVDQGGNFERVLCPNCLCDVTGQWSAWMKESFKSGFRSRSIRLVCCGSESELNSLIYEWPAGFSLFLLEVMNPNPAHWLSEEGLKRIEMALGCRVRQIPAHYLMTWLF